MIISCLLACSLACLIACLIACVFDCLFACLVGWLVVCLNKQMSHVINRIYTPASCSAFYLERWHAVGHYRGVLEVTAERLHAVPNPWVQLVGTPARSTYRTALLVAMTVGIFIGLGNWICIKGGVGHTLETWHHELASYTWGRIGMFRDRNFYIQWICGALYVLTLASSRSLRTKLSGELLLLNRLAVLTACHRNKFMTIARSDGIPRGRVAHMYIYIYTFIHTCTYIYNTLFVHISWATTASTKRLVQTLCKICTCRHHQPLP